MEFYSRYLTELDDFWLEDYKMAILDLEKKFAKKTWTKGVVRAAAVENAKEEARMAAAAKKAGLDQVKSPCHED